MQSHSVRTIEIPLCFSVANGRRSALGGNAGRGRHPYRYARRALCVLRRADSPPAQRAGAHLQAHLRARTGVHLSGRGGRRTRLSALLPALSIVGEVLPSQELKDKLHQPAAETPSLCGFGAGQRGGQGRTALRRYGHPPFQSRNRDRGRNSPTASCLLRDGRAETELLDFFSDAGFVVRQGRIVLRRAKDILAFCTQGVTDLGKIAGGVRIRRLPQDETPPASAARPPSACRAGGCYFRCWRAKSRSASWFPCSRLSRRVSSTCA